MRRAPDQDARAQAARIADALAGGESVPRTDVAMAVRTTLALLAHLHPGKLVEVRVAPWAAVQIGVPGRESAHTRGTPPNVVEADAATWLALAGGHLTWASALTDHRVSASGAHADLTHQIADLTRTLTLAR